MTLTAAEQLAVLKQMTADQPWRPDRRSPERIEYDAALESSAEDREYLRRHPTDGDSEWASRRWAG